MINSQMLGAQDDFIGQMKNFARSFLQWVSEEGQEAEHPGAPGVDQLPQGSTTPGGGAVPMPSAPHEEEQVQPVLLRSRTTTVHDYTPGGGVGGVQAPGSTTPTAPTSQSASQGLASDPPVSQAQRGAMHAAAAGNSTLGIPKSVGQEFAGADPGGKLPEKKGYDDGGGGERFALTPDGRVTDSVSGKSYSMEEVAQILFSGDQPQDGAAAQIEPAGRVPISQPNTEVNTAQWQSPRINAPGKDDHELGEGLGGEILGKLLNFQAGGKQPHSLPPRGGQLQPRGGAMPVRDRGWQSPKFGAR